MADAPLEIKLSATILLLRDGAPGLEVFMVQRHHQIDFAHGALVFPGGKVDAADAGALMRDHCQGSEGLDDSEVTLRVAAIRETFEEAGVLLARPRGARGLVDAEQLAGIENRRREALQNGRITLRELVELEDLVLACDLLVPFAHWITPEVLPKRFDTHFFLVAAPSDQLALHDGGETIDSVWTTVAAAVRAEREGERTIIFPTLVNLRKLGRSSNVADAMAAARTSRIVTVLPRVARDDDGDLKLFIPREADYDVVKAPLSELH